MSSSAMRTKLQARLLGRPLRCLGSEMPARPGAPRLTGSDPSKGRIGLVAAVCLLLLSSAPMASAQLRPEARLLLLAPSEDDARIELTRQAVAFWTSTFEELGLEAPWGDVDVVVGSPATRALENYSRGIWQRAGRPAAGSFEPAPPPELSSLDAEVVVFFSGLDLMPFAWPLPGSSRYFIAIHAEAAAAGPRDPGERSVIAHELGHALGLVHQTDPGSLMCLPCDLGSGEGSEAAALAVTEKDRERLVSLYGGRH